MSDNQAPTTRESRNLGGALLRALDAEEESPIPPSNTFNPLEPSHNDLETETPNLTALYNELWAQHNWLGAGYNALVADNSNQHNRNEALVAEKKRLVLQLTDHQAKSQYFEDENTKLKRDFGIMVLHITDFQNTVDDLRSENARIRDTMSREVELQAAVAHERAFSHALHEVPEGRSRWEEQWAQATTAVVEGQVQTDTVAIPDLMARNLHLEKAVAFHQQEIEHLKTVISSHVDTITDLETQKVDLLDDPYRWARRDEVYEALRLENRVQVERYMAKQAELDSLEGYVNGAVMQEVRINCLEARNRSHRNQIRRLEGELARWEGSYEDDDHASRGSTLD